MVRLKALEIAKSSPKPRSQAIDALQELPLYHTRVVVVPHLRVLSAEAFGFAQRVVLLGDEPKLLSAEQHEIGRNEFGSLSASRPGPRSDALLGCQHCASPIG